MDPNCTETLNDPRFVKKARWFIRVFVQMLDKALDMLGPDVELLTEVLLELGQRHVRYGVKPEYFPSLGKVLIDILSDTIDPKIFTQEVKNDWVEVYGALSQDMIRGQKMVNT
jgi:hemoglobin-like flavoprotein